MINGKNDHQQAARPKTRVDAHDKISHTSVSGPIGGTPVFVACDDNDSTGEGRLARVYAKNAYGVTIKNAGRVSLNGAVSGQVVSPVITTQLRVFHSLSAYSWLLWQMIMLRFGAERNVVVLNYLPLWNVLFFLAVPRWVYLAPLTGGGVIDASHLRLRPFQRLIVRLSRNFLIPNLYRLSRWIIRWRGLRVRPATSGVAHGLKMTADLPRFVESDASVFHHDRGISKGGLLNYDLVVYVGAHPMKNRELTLDVVEALARDGVSIVVIGHTGRFREFGGNVTFHQSLSREEVLNLMTQTRGVLSLSLELAGFFTFEAAALGLTVLCLPNSGGASLPGAVLLDPKDGVISPEALADQCKEMVRSLQTMTAAERESISKLTLKVHKKAHAYFSKN